MKKRLVLVPSLLTVALLAGCNLSSSSNENELKVEGTKDETIKKLARQTVLGLSGLEVNSSDSRKLKDRSFTEEEVEDIQNVLAQVDVFLNETNKLKVEEVKSDKEGYLNRLDLSFFDKAISLYYNDVNEKEEIEDDEVEKTIAFKGIALYDDLELEFHFVSELEEETDETENETTLILYKDESNYIEISQEHESEIDETEVSYSYKEVVDSKEVLDFELSVEEEYNEKKVEVEINEIEYEFKYETRNNKEYIVVEYEKEDLEVEGLFEKVEYTDEEGNKSNKFVYVE